MIFEGDAIRIHAENLVDSATITASSENPEYPAEFLRDTGRTQSWRSTGGVSEWVVFDAGENQAYADSLIVVNHNLIAGSFRIQASDDADFSTLLLDEEFDAQEEVFLFGDGGFGEHGFGGYLTEDENARYSPDFVRIYYFRAGGVFARYWRPRLTEPVETGLAFLEVGRFVLGPFLEPQYNFKSIRLVPMSDSEKTRTDGGQRTIDKKPKRKKLVIEFSVVAGEEINLTWFDLFYSYEGTDIMIVLFLDEPDFKYMWSIYCTVAGTLPGIGRIDEEFGDIDTMEFEESL